MFRLDESLTAKLEENIQNIENKLDNFIEDNKSYALAVKNRSTPASSPVANLNWDTPEMTSRNSKTDDNLRLIIEEARNEQLTQEREIKERSTNLIIHVVAEMRESDSSRTEDEVFVKSLLEAIDVKVNYKSIRSLVKPDTNPKRPN